MAENRALRKSITMMFKLNGLSVKGDACDYLMVQFQPLNEAERDSWLTKVIEFLQKKKTLNTPVVEKHHLVSAVEECCKSEINSADDILHVFSAFEIPKFYYDHDSKKFVKQTSNVRNVFSSAEAKINVFRKRYSILKQRLARHELLSGCNSNLENSCSVNMSVTRNNDSTFPSKLCPIDYLLSSPSDGFEVVVFGLLSQLKEGKYYLEDPTGYLLLDLSQAVYHNGLFCENCFILVEGVYSNGVLQVQGLAMPPPEPSKISRNYFGNVNTFGGASEVSLKLSSRMLQIEEKNAETMIVFVADIWLDSVKVMEKVKKLFDGYNEYSPVAIVLMGNFLSKPYGSQHSHMLRSKFKELAEIIAKNEALVRDTIFVIVPGPTDSPFANILPKPPLPSFIIEEFQKRIPKCILATNPCRLQYCTQEITIFREDILTKMCRNCIRFPDTGDISTHFVKTILSQCYLTPIPLSICPIYWSEDDSLILYPLPDVLVIADQMSSFSMMNKECIIFNPSSFSKRQFCFNVYIPATKQVEDSQIPDQ